MLSTRKPLLLYTLADHSSVKSEGIDPKNNPYLAHYYEEQEPDEDTGYGGYSNGYQNPPKRMNGLNATAPSFVPRSQVPRHATTAAMAEEAEYGPNNPCNGQPLSQQYFSILKTRRNLPVHQQR